MKIHEHKIIKIKDLKPYDYNTRDHSTEQIMQVKESIKKYGFTNPLLIDEKNNIIAGHCRLEAIKALNNLDFKDNPILELPCVIVKDLSEIDFKALSIIDNKLASNATWNEKNLLNELESLEFVNFDLSELGFSESEINNIMGESEINNIMGESEINFKVDNERKSNGRAITFYYPFEDYPSLSDFIEKNKKNAFFFTDDSKEQGYSYISVIITKLIKIGLKNVNS